MKVSINQLKQWFVKQAKPTQAQFWNWMDSYWHKDDQIPVSSIENLATLINSKATTEITDGLQEQIDNLPAGAGGGTIDYQLTEQLIPFEKYKGQDMYAILLPVSDENGNPYTYVNHADILFISVGKVISEWLVANPSNKIVYINPITPDFTLAQPYDYRWNFPEVLVKYIKEGENFLLQENGDNILQENGDNILI